MTALTYTTPSTLTLRDLVEGVMLSVYGQTAQTDVIGTLGANLDSSSLTFMVTPEEAEDFGAGLVEIDSELIRVTSVDEDGTVKIHPSGRGVRATTAAAHTAGAEVRMAPILPYSSVIREINAELRSYYPRLCATNYTEFTYSATKITYQIPTGAGIVLDVRYKDSYGEWQRVRSWEVDFGQNTTDFASGITLRVDVPLSGATVRVIYGSPFGSLSALTDGLSTAGIPSSLEDVIRLGAVCRLLPTLDIGRLSVSSVSSADANPRPPSPGTGTIVTRELRAAYRDRLDQEVSTFRQYFPARVHLTR